jgi:hypothetical protein
MTQAETKIRHRVQLEASRRGWRLFRNSVGQIWHNDRLIRFGLCPGSSDLIGWRPVKITADMVGKTIALFTAREVKTSVGRATKEQIGFIRAVNLDGGDGKIVRGPDEL